MSQEIKNPIQKIESTNTLEDELNIYKSALQEIRDLPLEPSNSPTMTDQLWHFVRWSKSIARNALDRGSK